LVVIGPYNIELIPSTSLGSSLSRFARKNADFRAHWDQVLARELARARNTCEVCGSKEGLVCSERWKFDDASHVQRLCGFDVVCRDCHSVLDIGRGAAIGTLETTVKHILKVTGLEESAVKRAVGEAFRVWHERSKESWHIDVSFEPLAGDFENEINRLNEGSNTE
jgi:hypothetical protein